MHKQLLVLAIAAATATTGWTAERERAPKREAIGIGSGAVIGAAAGGPVGFVLGAAFGGWLGDRFEHEREQRIEAEERFATLNAEHQELGTLLARSERELDRVAAQLAAERTSHARNLEQALDVQVYFRTEQADLEPGAVERLGRIGELIRDLDGVAVLLEGHADGRGAAAYNEALSAARADAVRQVFIDAGVPAERIAVTAEGSNYAVADPTDLDALALERRVAVSIVGVGGERLARKH